MSWLGIDIGGANIKVADGADYAASHFFPLWLRWRQLDEELRRLIAEAPATDHLAITMTGELADCYENRDAGVLSILQAVECAVDQRHTRIYLRDGRLVSIAVAQRSPQLVAAANWHALARFAGRYAAQGPALLIDIGSTTTDLIPLVDGIPTSAAQTDLDRLRVCELVYTGVERSPVCAQTMQVRYRDSDVMLAQEFFATMLDVYITLGELPEEPQVTNTADGRPATKHFAHTRLARTICADGAEFLIEDAQSHARQLAAVQRQRIVAAAQHVIGRLASPPTTIITVGQGEFLARRVALEIAPQAKLVSLTEHCGPVISRCGPAHALAVLAREGSSRT
jgi:probable H4MPT-linked C1 transfer pathway protein